MKYRVNKIINPDQLIAQTLGDTLFNQNEVFPGYKNPMWKLHSVVATGTNNQRGEPLFWVIQYTEDRYLSEEEVKKELDNSEKK